MIVTEIKISENFLKENFFRSPNKNSQWGSEYCECGGKLYGRR